MYNGGKNGEGVYHTIINQIPPHKYYLEPFLGSGAIMRHKKLASIDNVGVEMDTSIIDKFHQGARYTVINGCGISYIQNRKDIFTPEHFIYCDPPYPFLSRRSSERNLYKYEMTDAQHFDLLQLLISIPAGIAISTYPNSIYAEVLKEWRYIDFPVMTRVGIATERLYMNYKAPIVLHDYSLLGSNFTDRQRIKRKINRHVNRLLQLPVLERSAIVEAINAAAQLQTPIPPAV